MKKILLSREIAEKDNKIAENLIKSGYKPVFLPPYKRLSEKIASHPDMLVSKTSSGIVMYSEYCRENPELISEIIRDREDISVELSGTLPMPKYPDDIGMNALRLGNRVFCLLQYIDPMLKKSIENDFGSAQFISVKQGYTRCSCCVVSDSAIITADRSVSSAASSCGIDVLTVSEGSIGLDGYGYGFIGGASAALDGATAFFGDIYRHPDAAEIEKFINGHGSRVVCLSDSPLYDYGGAVVI